MFHKEARKLIKKRIEILLNEWDFNVRIITHPDECPCYKENKPCHDINPDKMNCYFCMCPYYNLEREEGGCLKDGSGEWFYNEKLPKGRIWDCSRCIHLNEKENARKYLEDIFFKIH